VFDDFEAFPSNRQIKRGFTGDGMHGVDHLIVFGQEFLDFSQ